MWFEVGDSLLHDLCTLQDERPLASAQSRRFSPTVFMPESSVSFTIASAGFSFRASSRSTFRPLRSPSQLLLQALKERKLCEFFEPAS